MFWEHPYKWLRLQLILKTCSFLYSLNIPRHVFVKHTGTVIIQSTDLPAHRPLAPISQETSSHCIISKQPIRILTDVVTSSLCFCLRDRCKWRKETFLRVRQQVLFLSRQVPDTQVAVLSNCHYSLGVHRQPCPQVLGMLNCLSHL